MEQKKEQITCQVCHVVCAHTVSSSPMHPAIRGGQSVQWGLVFFLVSFHFAQHFNL